METEKQTEAWIDVGGTFTDCFTRSTNGEIQRCKVLSSGRVPISCRPATTPPLAGNLVDDQQDPTGVTVVEARELAADAQHFWKGAELLLLDSQGKERSRFPVVDFASGQLAVSGSIPAEALAADDTHSAWRWELSLGVEAPVLGVRRLLGIAMHQPLPRLRVRLGTTKGTNALLTRNGARTAFAVTAPFEDLLKIGDQTRPNLFELSIKKSPPLAEMTVGIRERLAADGTVLQQLDVQHAEQQLRRVLETGCRSLAICLMHSYVNPKHEQQLMGRARDLGFENVSCSTELAPLIEIVARSQTTVVDAYLSPIVRRYLRTLVEQFGAATTQLQVMTSAGGLVDWQNYFGKDSILSGPAGGVAALRAIGKATANDEMIGLDMGGTSTDVCRVSGEHNLQYESTKAGVRILTPTLPIETVASGGGSICWFDGVSLRVGPQSAGAMPGPACYGRGGPLTVTDLNVFVGRIPSEQFPFPLDHAAVTQRIGELLEQVSSVWPNMTHSELANGLRKIANEQMAEAVRTVSIAQGTDPRSMTLAGFGGAAGQHICEIAESLGMQTIVDSAEAGLLSALGMGLADVRSDDVVAVYQLLQDVDWGPLSELVESRTTAMHSRLLEDGLAAEQFTTAQWLELRYAATDTTLTIPLENPADVAAEFHSVHAQRYGYQRTDHAIELVAVRIECRAEAAHKLPIERRCQPTRQHTSKDAWLKIPRSQLMPGDQVIGPAIVLNAGSTLVVAAGWTAECLSQGTLMLHRSEATEPLSERPKNAASGHANMASPPLALAEPQFDPVFRDCFAARLSAIANQMGLVLQQTAVSVNVKQRRDFSCAVFDHKGNLLANAPHVPVHLGAMGETVRSILGEFPNIQRGDRFITNDPYRGGSHLPDVTLVTPVFDPDAAMPVMYVANRAHHADIGGIAPGSMSVNATQLGEEGVIIPPTRLSQGDAWGPELRSMLESCNHPPRNVTENLADVAAQLAANERGVELLSQYAMAESWAKLGRYAEHLLSAAETRVKQFVQANFSGERKFHDSLDDGTAIDVRIHFHADGTMDIDFTGSGPTNPKNFNANPSIVKAAVMYVLRCLIADELPLNEGVLRCVNLTVPTGVLNPPAATVPSESPAMAAGNVETSQRVVDVLLGAFDVAAASQGTMNNLLFGNERFGFYETICGGAGATPDADGASGVHTHMTNTRLTDPEVLEARYPVRLVQFGLREGSGGQGVRCGGEGVIREMEFLEPVTVSLLTSRRGEFAPFGLHGGQAGQRGENTLISADNRQSLLNCCEFQAEVGDRVLLQTPGGGGWGTATDQGQPIQTDPATQLKRSKAK